MAVMFQTSLVFDAGGKTVLWRKQQLWKYIDAFRIVHEGSPNMKVFKNKLREQLFS